MLKAKSYFFAAACMAGIISFSPIIAMAAETGTDSVTLSEKDKNKCGDSSSFEERMQQARQKWSSLSAEQKEEVYSLVEKKLQAENNVMDKLVELGVMQKADVERSRTRMTEEFKKMKDNGDFPFMMRHKKMKGNR